MIGSDRLELLYAAGEFRIKAEEITRQLERYFSETVVASHVTDWGSPHEAIRSAGQFLDEPGQFAAAVRFFIDKATKLHSPHCMGHQVAPPLPVASLFEWLGASLNQGSALFEIGQSSNGIERAIIERLGKRVGWETGFDGFATHGGTVANLTALLAARNSRFQEAWQRGLSGFKPVMIASKDAHYSMERAAGVMGLGTDSVRSVAIDHKRRLDPADLARVLEKAKASGETPFVVVATSGSTSVGAFDDLSQIAAICRAHGVWLHVDAAHGGGLLFSQTLKPLLAGIEQADSITWDAHKMLYTPGLSTFLLFREKHRSFQTFSQNAPYLFDEEPLTPPDLDAGLRSLECTRRAIALSLWGTWSCYGDGVFAELAETVVENTHRFYEILAETADFKAEHEPQANILCFRYLPKHLAHAPEPEISQFQQRLRQKLVASGRFYLTRTRLDGRSVLRVTVMNPFTTDAHWRALLDACRVSVSFQA